MKSPDLDRERSEKKITLVEFLKSYNKDLPAAFPHASRALLEEFRESYPGQFRADGLWSLDQHRKKFMDWLPMHLKMQKA